MRDKTTLFDEEQRKTKQDQPSSLVVMTTLNQLVEAAKYVECDEGALLEERRRSTHKMLEKNRRAEMRDYYDMLKVNVPKINDWVKCSHISILTAATKHIAELNAIDYRYQREKEQLCRTQMELKDRIRMLLRDEKILLEQLLPSDNDVPDYNGLVMNGGFEMLNRSNKPPTTTTTTNNVPPIKKKKKMVSVEVQVNEHDIKSELPNISRLVGGIGSYMTSSRTEFASVPSPTDPTPGENDNFFFGSTPNIITRDPNLCLPAPLACLSNGGTTGAYSFNDNILSASNNNCNYVKSGLKGVSRRKRKHLLQ